MPPACGSACNRDAIGETARVTTFPTNRDRLVSRAWAERLSVASRPTPTGRRDTHLHAFPLPEDWGIDLYLKDESVHPTGS